MATIEAARGADDLFLQDEALRALEIADKALAFAQGIVDAPFRPEDITREFIESVFAERVRGVRLLEMVDDGGHEGMAARRRLILKWDAAGQQAGLPAVVFAKGIRDLPQHLETIAVKHYGENEDRFYNQLRAELPDIAPICYYARSYVGGRYMLLMEDLSERGATLQWMHYQCSIEYAREVMKTLALLHGKYWQSDRFHTDLSWVRPRSARYGKFWFKELFNTYRASWLKTERGEAMPDALRDLLLLWDRHEQNFYRYRDETRPQTLCHGDTHLGNTYKYADGRAGLLDWQIILRGAGVSEAAHFVMSAFNDEERRRYDRELFGVYVDALEARGIKIDREQTWDDWCLSIFYIWDCTLTSTQLGTYGHHMDAFARRWDTTSKAMLEYDVPGRFNAALRRAGVL